MPSRSHAPALDKPLCREGIAGSRHICELAVRRLEDKQYPQLRRIHCDYHEGVMTLRGVVSSFHLKQVAQAALVGLDGVEEIANRLEVRYRH